MSGMWKTKDGTTLRISDMTNSHLANAIRHLEREHKRYAEESTAAWRMSACFNGEMAQDSAEYLDEVCSTIRQKMDELNAELERRASSRDDDGDEYEWHDQHD